MLTKDCVNIVNKLCSFKDLCFLFYFPYFPLFPLIFPYFFVLGFNWIISLVLGFNCLTFTLGFNCLFFLPFFQIHKDYYKNNKFKRKSLMEVYIKSVPKKNFRYRNIIKKWYFSFNNYLNQQQFCPAKRQHQAHLHSYKCNPSASWQQHWKYFHAAGQHFPGYPANAMFLG